MRWLVAVLTLHAALAQVKVKVVEKGPESPVEGALVQVRLVAVDGPVRYRMRQPEPCQTDAAGECRFLALVPGNYAVKVSRQGYVDAEDTQSREAGFIISLPTSRLAAIEARMVRTGSVHGTVFSEDGKPVALAPLRLRPMAPEALRRTPAILLRTDEKGVFSAADVVPGRYGMWISPPGRLREATRKLNQETGEEIGYPVAVYHTGVEEEHWVEPIEVWPGAELRNRVVVIRQMRVFTLRGQLIDAATKQPLTSARVALRTGDATREEVYSQRPLNPRTAAFSFASLSPGDYELLVYRPSPDSSPPWVTPVTVERGRGAADQNLVVPPWADLPGRIMDLPGRSIRNDTRVAFEPESSPADVVPATVEPQGRFIARNLPPGRYTLRVSTPDGCYAAEARMGQIDALERGFTLTSQNAVEMIVTVGCATGAIRGESVNARNEPASRSYVALGPENLDRIRRTGAVQLTRTGPAGEYYFAGLAPGTYRLVALRGKPEIPIDSPAFWKEFGPDSIKAEVRENQVAPVFLRVVEPAAK